MQDEEKTKAQLIDELIRLRQKVAELEIFKTRCEQAKETLKIQAQILKNLAEGVHVSDENAIIFYTNPAFDAMFGYEQSNLIGKHASVLNPGPPEKSMCIADEILKHLEKKGIWSGELNSIRKDGTIFPTHAFVSTMEVSGKKYLITIQKDITQRKQRELALQESEYKYRTLFENMTHGVFYQQADGVLFDINPAALEIFGLAREEFFRRTSYSPEWKVIHEDGTTFPVEEHPSMKALITGQPVRNVIAGVWNPRKKDYIWLNINAIPQFREGEETPYQVFVTLHDITRRKQAEEERLKMEQQIQQARKFESLNLMAASIAHNFNNILFIVSGNLELASEALPPASLAREYIKSACKGTNRAIELVKLMLTYVGHQKSKIQVLNIKRLLNRIISSLKISVPENIRIRLNSPLDNFLFEGDLLLIEQMITNLLTNATEAIGDEKGEIIISTGVLYETFDAFQFPFSNDNLPEGDYLYFEVSDTGCGMNEDVLSKIYDPFFTTKFTGRGLGMATVLGIMRLHRGAISVESKPGNGTKIKVMFPVLKTNSK